MASPSKVTLRLLIDKNASKIIFAEASKDALDFICKILTLPEGLVNWLRTEEYMGGCISNFYRSIEKLNNDYVQPNQHNVTFVMPNVQATLIFPNLTNKIPEPKRLYRCNTYVTGARCSYVTNICGTRCPRCGSSMTFTDVYTFVDGKSDTGDASCGRDGGVMNDVVKFIVFDDLVVSPMSISKLITSLNKFNAKDMNGLEEKVVVLDMTKGMKMLKTSFISKNVLTEIFL